MAPHQKIPEKMIHERRKKKKRKKKKKRLNGHPVVA